MRRRIKILGIVSMAAFLMTGCGSDFPKLTDEQESAVGEYAAITLLKYDVNNRSRLVDLSGDEETTEENLPAQPEPEPEPAVEEPSSEPEPEPDTPVIEIGDKNGADSFESFYELPEGITLVYSGSEVQQSYGGDDNDYFSLEASEGKRLLILRFILHNATGAGQEIDFIDRKDAYRVTVNDDYTRSALTTFLPNDLSSYKGTVEAGAGKEVVLVLEIEPEQAQNLTSIVLNLKNESNTYTIQLL